MESSRKERLVRHLSNPHAPVFLALCANSVFVVMNGVVQHLEHTYNLPSSEIIFIRMSINLPICMIYLYTTSQSPLRLFFEPEAVNPWIRGLLGASSILFEFAAFKLIPLTEVISVYHLKPIPVALLCFLFLGERFTRIQIFACVMSICAVFLIFQPAFLFPGHASDGTDTPTKVLGYGLTIVSLNLAAADLFVTRVIGETVHAIPLLAMYASSCIVLSPIWMLIDRSRLMTDMPWRAWLELLFVGLSAFFGELLFTLALQRERAGKIALLGYCQVVLAILIQFVFVGTLPTLWGFVGMGIIVLTGIWAAISATPLERDKQYEVISDTDAESLASGRVHIGEDGASVPRMEGNESSLLLGE